MTPQESVARLIADNPSLHVLSEENVKALARYGVHTSPGAANHAVPPAVLRYFTEVVKPDHLTIETGCGHTTVALAALARHHTSVTDDATSAGLIKEYMARVGIPSDKVTFMVESSDMALPKLPTEQVFDFAFIDGSHSYPLPTIDWHYIDLRLKVGGLLGLDNMEIPAVYDVSRFLEENRTYELVRRMEDANYSRRYATNFYRKLKDDHRDAFEQPWLLRPARRRTWQEWLADVRWRRRKTWPWD